ncbi:unnamed protein product [Brassica oleracea]
MFPQASPVSLFLSCVSVPEELLLRRLIAPQVNQLLQVAQKCQTTISESGVLGAGRQLAKFMELQSLNDLGYPKRYIRTLQISEVVKSMKDLMNFTGDHKLGPIEGLKRLLEQTATAKLQRQKMQEMEQLGNSGAIYGSSQAQMALTSGTMNDLTGNSNNNNQTVGRAAMNGSAQAAAALTNYQSMLMRQNAMNNPNSNTCKQDAFSSQNPTPNSNQSPKCVIELINKYVLDTTSCCTYQKNMFFTSPSSSSHQMQQQQRTMNGAPSIIILIICTHHMVTIRSSRCFTSCCRRCLRTHQVCNSNMPFQVKVVGTLMQRETQLPPLLASQEEAEFQVATTVLQQPQITIFICQKMYQSESYLTVSQMTASSTTVIFMVHYKKKDFY